MWLLHLLLGLHHVEAQERLDPKTFPIPYKGKTGTAVCAVSTEFECFKPNFEDPLCYGDGENEYGEFHTYDSIGFCRVKRNESELSELTKDLLRRGCDYPCDMTTKNIKVGDVVRVVMKSKGPTTWTRFSTTVKEVFKSYIVGEDREGQDQNFLLYEAKQTDPERPPHRNDDEPKYEILDGCKYWNEEIMERCVERFSKARHCFNGDFCYNAASATGMRDPLISRPIGCNTDADCTGWEFNTSPQSGFHKDTLIKKISSVDPVTTEDASLESLEEGDYVATFDDSSGKIVPSRVIGFTDSSDCDTYTDLYEVAYTGIDNISASVLMSELNNVEIGFTGNFKDNFYSFIDEGIKWKKITPEEKEEIISILEQLPGSAYKCDGAEDTKSVSALATLLLGNFKGQFDSIGRLKYEGGTCRHRPSFYKHEESRLYEYLQYEYLVSTNDKCKGINAELYYNFLGVQLKFMDFQEDGRGCPRLGGTQVRVSTRPHFNGTYDEQINGFRGSPFAFGVSVCDLRQPIIANGMHLINHDGLLLPSFPMLKLNALLTPEEVATSDLAFMSGPSIQSRKYEEWNCSGYVFDDYYRSIFENTDRENCYGRVDIWEDPPLDFGGPCGDLGIANYLGQEALMIGAEFTRDPVKSRDPFQPQRGGDAASFFVQPEVAKKAVNVLQQSVLTMEKYLPSMAFEAVLAQIAAKDESGTNVWQTAMANYLMSDNFKVATAISSPVKDLKDLKFVVQDMPTSSLPLMWATDGEGNLDFLSFVEDPLAVTLDYASDAGSYLASCAEQVCEILDYSWPPSTAPLAAATTLDGDGDADPGLPGGAIAAIIMVPILLLGLCGAFFIVRKGRKKKQVDVEPSPTTDP